MINRKKLSWWYLCDQCGRVVADRWARSHNSSGCTVARGYTEKEALRNGLRQAYGDTWVREVGDAT